MKTTHKIFYAVLVSIVPILLNASDQHTHEGHAHHGHYHHEKVAGPNGGKMIFSVEPHIEFLMLEDKRAQISFYDHDMEGIAHGEQFVALVGGTQKDPIKVHFEKQGDVLLSKDALPVTRQALPVVLIIKVTEDAPMKYERFYVDLRECGSCDLQEYACTCDHGH